MPLFPTMPISHGFRWLTKQKTAGYSRLNQSSSSSSSEADPNEKLPPRPPSRWTKLFCLLPSFLQPRTSGEEVGSGRRKHPSAWLDGVRGLAAFIVVWHHSSLLYFSWDIHSAWFQWGDDIIKFPFIRLFIAGAPAVCIFFVISGYAISLKLLKLSHLRRHADFNEALCSSLFRRHPRLFMPAAAVLFLTGVMSHFGAFPTEPWREGVAIATRVPERDADSFFHQLVLWAHQILSLSNPLRDLVNSRDYSPWDPNLWTLPVEFGCSMLIFSVLAVTHMMPPLIRMGFNAALITYCLVNADVNVLLFLMGMFLADVRMYRTNRQNQASQLPLTTPDRLEPPKWRRRLHFKYSKYFIAIYRSEIVRKIFWLLAFLTSIYLLGMPELGRGANDAPGFSTLARLVPQKYRDRGREDYFWVPLGAGLLIASVDYGKFLQVLFTNRFSQYLGDISFSLYLIHGPLLWSYGIVLARHFVGLTGSDTATQYGGGIALCYLFFWPVAIYEADVIWRLVDVKSVDVTRYVYTRMTRH